MPDNEKLIYSRTLKGNVFLHQDLSSNEYDIFEIANSLSKTCRANGHFNKFFSVASHSIILAEYFIKRNYDYQTIRTALLHDATEAYIGDITSPIKDLIPEIREYEEKIYEVIAIKFNLYRTIPTYIKLQDKKSYFLEISNLNDYNFYVPQDEILDAQDSFSKVIDWGIDKTRDYFLELYDKYKG